MTGPASRAADQVATSLRSRLDARLSTLNQQLAQKIISPEQFERRAGFAAARFNEGLLAGISVLRQRGILTPDIEQRLTNQLSVAGRVAGGQTARTIAQGIAAQEPEIAAAIESSINEGMRRANLQAAARAREIRTAYVQAFAQAGQTLQSFGRTATVAVTLPIAGLSVQVIRAASRMDQLERGLRAVTGSASEASRQISELAEVAELPGINFEQAVQGSTNLQLLGFSAENARRTLVGVGNAIALAGGGRPELERVSTQLIQMASAARVLTLDLRPIIQQAPGVGRAISQLFGTVRAEDIEGLGLEIDEFFTLLNLALETLPTPAIGVAEILSQIGDDVLQTSAAIGGALVPALNEAGLALQRFLEGLRETEPATIRTFAAFAAAVAVIGPLATGLGVLASAFAVLGTIIGGGAVAAIAGVSAAFAGIAVLLVGSFLKVRFEAAAAKKAQEDYNESLHKLSPTDAIEDLRGLEEAMAAVRNEQGRIRREGIQFESGAILEQFHALEEEFQRLAESADIARARINGIETGDVGTRLQSVTEEVGRLVSSFHSLQTLGRDTTAAQEAIEGMLVRLERLADLEVDPQILTDILALQALLTATIRPTGLEDTEKQIKSSLDRIQALLREARITSPFNLFEVGDLPDGFREAFERAEQLRGKLDTLSGELEKLSEAGGGAPTGALALLERLRQGVADAEEEVTERLNRLVASFNNLENLQITPQITTLPIDLQPIVDPFSLQSLEDQFDRTEARIKFRFLEGLIDRTEMERQGREAAENFNEGLLTRIRVLLASGDLQSILQGLELAAELKVVTEADIDLLSEAQQRARAATESFNQGVQASNEVLSAFDDLAKATGLLSQGMAAALRALSTIGAGVSRIKFGDELVKISETFTGAAASSTKLLGTLAQASGAITVFAGAVGVASGVYDALTAASRRREREEIAATRALERFRLTLQGFDPGNASNLQKALDAVQPVADIAQNLRFIVNATANSYKEAARIIGEFANSAGLTIDQLIAIAAQFDLPLFDEEGRPLIDNFVRLIPFLQEARAALGRFTDSLDDLRTLLDAENTIRGVEVTPEVTIRGELDLLDKLAPAIAQAFGLSADLTLPEIRQIIIRIFEDIENGMGEGILTEEMLAALPEGVRTLVDILVNIGGALNELQADAIDLGRAYDRARRLMEAERTIRGVEVTPEIEIRGELDLLAQFAPQLLAAFGLDNIDLSLPGAAEQLRQVIVQVFEALKAGTIDPELLAGLPEGADTLLEVLVNIGGSLNSMRDNVDKVNEALVNVPQGFRILNLELARFNASRAATADELLGNTPNAPIPPPVGPAPVVPEVPLPGIPVPDFREWGELLERFFGPKVDGLGSRFADVIEQRSEALLRRINEGTTGGSTGGNSQVLDVTDNRVVNISIAQRTDEGDEAFLERIKGIVSEVMDQRNFEDGMVFLNNPNGYRPTFR